MGGGIREGLAGKKVRGSLARRAGRALVGWREQGDVPLVGKASGRVPLENKFGFRGGWVRKNFEKVGSGKIKTRNGMGIRSGRVGVGEIWEDVIGKKLGKVAWRKSPASREVRLGGNSERFGAVNIRKGLSTSRPRCMARLQKHSGWNCGERNKKIRGDGIPKSGKGG